MAQPPAPAPVPAAFAAPRGPPPRPVMPAVPPSGYAPPTPAGPAPGFTPPLPAGPPPVPGMAAGGGGGGPGPYAGVMSLLDCVLARGTTEHDIFREPGLSVDITKLKQQADAGRGKRARGAHRTTLTCAPVPPNLDAFDVKAVATVMKKMLMEKDPVCTFEAFPHFIEAFGERAAAVKRLRAHRAGCADSQGVDGVADVAARLPAPNRAVLCKADRAPAACRSHACAASENPCRGRRAGREQNVHERGPQVRGRRCSVLCSGGVLTCCDAQVSGAHLRAVDAARAGE
jgi:hypothetical protein